MGVQRLGFRSVVFDCDSTLASVEGIDELAADYLSEVRALTDAAMRGQVKLEEVYGRRLEIIRPSRSRVEALGRLYVERVVDDARETIDALQWLGKDVRVISGGLRPPVLALTRELGIRPRSVAAVDIEFSDDGAYLRFENGSPLARSQGKAEVIRNWNLERPSLMVGDGATDLEARPEVDSFVAYMGVVYRENVASGADLVIESKSLAPILSIAASESDRSRLAISQWHPLLAHGDALLGNPV
ncbi:MAG: HAD-IB family phosphatase [Gemmatimonas sp.]|nr:HAD-IB family phosphatase [Gemmatimonas sp.]